MSPSPPPQFKGGIAEPDGFLHTESTGHDDMGHILCVERLSLMDLEFICTEYSTEEMILHRVQMVS